MAGLASVTNTSKQLFFISPTLSLSQIFQNLLPYRPCRQILGQPRIVFARPLMPVVFVQEYIAKYLPARLLPRATSKGKFRVQNTSGLFGGLKNRRVLLPFRAIRNSAVQTTKYARLKVFPDERLHI